MMQLHIIVCNVTKKQLENDNFFNMFILTKMYLHITVSNVTKKQLEKDIRAVRGFLKGTAHLYSA